MLTISTVGLSVAVSTISLRYSEALLRICPYPESDDVDIAKRFNLEYRAADACASPYLQLAMMVYAGLEGLRENLPPPPITTGDPGDLTLAERERLGIAPLPRSLEEALAALQEDESAMAWLGPVLSEAYVMHKRGELGMTVGQDIDQLCQTYARAY